MGEPRVFIWLVAAERCSLHAEEGILVWSGLFSSSHPSHRAAYTMPPTRGVLMNVDRSNPSRVFMFVQYTRIPSSLGFSVARFIAILGGGWKFGRRHFMY